MNILRAVFADAERGKLKGSGQPESFAYTGRAPSVLSFHGFGGTPFEVKLVHDVAMELGLTSRAPILPGHGTHARDLAKTRWTDWSQAATRQLDELSENGPVIVAGLSLGSLVATHLAATSDKVIGLILIANAAWLANPFPSFALRVARKLNLPDFMNPKGPSDITDHEARAVHVSYSADPVHAAIDVLRAGERIREQFARVRCPTLILHGAKDRVCPVSNAWRVGERLGTSDQRTVIYPRSRHILTEDVERDAVAAEVRTFLTRLSR